MTAVRVYLLYILFMYICACVCVKAFNEKVEWDTKTKGQQAVF